MIKQLVKFYPLKTHLVHANTYIQTSMCTYSMFLINVINWIDMFLTAEIILLLF